MRNIFGNMIHVTRYLFIGQVIHFSKLPGVHNGAATKLQRFKPLISVHHIAASEYYAVIFHYHRLITFIFEFFGNFFTQIFASRRAVRRKTDVAAHVMRLRNNFGIGYRSGNAESDQCGRMRVNDGRDIGTRFVNGSVKRIFR